MAEIIYKTEGKLELKSSNTAEISKTVVAVWEKGKGSSVSLREGSQTVHLDISQLKEFRLSVDKMIGDLS